VAKRSHGEGSVTKRKNGTYLAQVSIESKRVSKTFRTRKEAQEWIITTTGQVNMGLTLSNAKITVEELLNTWLNIKQSKTRPASDYQYRRMSKAYILPHLGNYKINDLSAAKIQEFYTVLESQGIGASTIKLCHIILHGLFKYAQRLGITPQNWAALVECPKPKKKELNVWNESQVNQFLVAVEGDPFYRMAFSTGMRRGELLGLQWKDLDWENGMIKVSRQVYNPSGGGFIFQPPKTERGRRAIRIGPGLIESLRKHYNYTIPNMIAIAGPDKWQDHDLIFPSRYGVPQVGSTITKGFKRLLEKFGLSEIRFHDIRHTTASIMLLHGEPPVRVAGVMGHSVQVLLNTYSHYIPDNQERLSNLMDQITTTIQVDFDQEKRLHHIATDKANY
jgi:integrase